MPRYRGRRGCRQLRELATLRRRAMPSPRPSRGRASRSSTPGLPVPTPQVEVDLEGWGQVRLDLAYLHLKIAIEYDGAEFHGEDRRDHDLARRAALRRAGWFVLVVRKEDLAAGTWLSELRAELTSRRTPAKRVYSRARVRTVIATSSYLSATSSYPSATSAYHSATSTYPSATSTYPSATSSYPSATSSVGERDEVADVEAAVGLQAHRLDADGAAVAVGDQGDLGLAARLASRRRWRTPPRRSSRWCRCSRPRRSRPTTRVGPVLHVQVAADDEVGAAAARAPPGPSSASCTSTVSTRSSASRRPRRRPGAWSSAKVARLVAPVAQPAGARVVDPPQPRAARPLDRRSRPRLVQPRSAR